MRSNAATARRGPPARGNWRDLLAELFGLPTPVESVLTAEGAEQQPVGAVACEAVPPR